MPLAHELVPLTVLLPLGIAFVLLILAHWLPPRSADVTGIVTALVLIALCGWLGAQALHEPIVYWFGGWTPQVSGKPGVVLGIAFSVDPASAMIAAFCALLFAATFVFTWGYFDNIHAHFHVLMLLFLAAMIGFCVTRDLFDLFVWSALMDIAAFALTAYPLGKSSLEGALNFTITNGVGSYLMLAGIGLLYSHTGSLDFVTMGHAIAATPSDPVIAAGFCLVAVAILTKAAIVPFHMWLADAHAVAPSPLSVIFSGVMVSVPLFVLLKLIVIVFAGDPQVMMLVHGGLYWLGIATAIIGGLMTWAQRHFRRMLAFATISHVGIMLIAVAAVTSSGTEGFLVYLIGHGLVQGALFMIAGIFLACFKSVDEIVLYRKGRRIWPVGVAMAMAGLLLGGLPWGLMHDATDPILAGTYGGAALAAIILGTALTGAAVLRAAGRIFLGWSGAPGVELAAPTQRESEKGGRPIALMLAPCALLLAIALLPESLVGSFIQRAATGLVAYGSPHAGADLWATALTIALTILIPAASLLRLRPTRRIARLAAKIEAAPFNALQVLHSGRVTDYVVWMMVGLAVLAGMLKFG